MYVYLPSLLQLSAQLLQDGRHEDLDASLEEQGRHHRHALAAAEADVDEEEAEHMRQITESGNADHLQQIRHMERNLLNTVSDHIQ